MNVPRSPADLVHEMNLEMAKSPRLLFVVLEGSDDLKYWKSRLRRDDCRCIIALGKANVTGALTHAHRKPPALGIIDADYDHLDGIACPDAVCRTDAHDLEALMVHSGALPRLLYDKGSADKIDGFERDHGPVLERLVSMGTELARLRRANHQQRWALKFKKNGGKDRINYGKFVDKKSWTLDREKMVGHLQDYNSRRDLPAAEMLAAMARITSPSDPWHWLNGHDLAAILAIGLSSVLGTENCATAAVEEALRLAHDRAELEKTSLCQAIRGWETSTGRSLLAF